MALAGMGGWMPHFKSATPRNFPIDHIVAHKTPRHCRTLRKRRKRSHERRRR